MKLDNFLIPYTKINSKQNKGLTVRSETIKMLEETTGSNFSDISHRNIFLDMSPEARELKAKINYWDFINIKTSAQQRKQSTKLKGNLWNGRRYLQMIYLIKGQ